MKDENKTEKQLVAELRAARQRIAELEPSEAARKHAEAALKDSEVLYHSLVDNLPQNVFRKDPEGKFTFADRNFCATLGKPLHEVLGKTDFDFYPEELARKYREDDKQVIEKKEIFQAIEEHQTPDGRSMFVRVMKTPVYDSKGNIAGIQGMFWDVTSQELAEKALAEERNLLRAVIDNVPDHVYVKDSESRFIHANSAVARHMRAQTPDDLIGKTDYDFYPEEIASHYWKDDRTVIESGEPLINSEEVGVDPQGNPMRFLCSKIPLRDKAGNIVAIVGSSRDITKQKQVEEALRNSEALYHSLVECLPQNIFRKDLEGRFTFANANFCATLKKRPEDIIGKTDFDFYPEELVRKYREDDRKVIRTGESFESTEDHKTPDGRTMFVHVMKTPVYDAKGQITGIQGIFWDVTEQKQSEQAIRDSEALYQSLVESLPLNVLRKDLEGRFTFGNRLFCETIGLPLDEIIGKTDFDFFPKELAEKYRQDDAKVVETGEIFEDTEKHQTPDGSTNYVQVFKTPVRNFQGNVIGTQGIFWDVTNRRLAEEALARERYRMDSLMKNLPDNIYFKDAQSRFTRISNALAFQFGLSDPQEAIGKTDFDFFTEEHARAAFEDEQEVITHGQPLIGKEEKETWSAGKVTWASTTKMPLRDEQGNIVGTFGVSRDITDRKRAQEELKKTAAELASSNAELEQFAYVASHDLQEPLRMVASYTQLLAKRYVGKLDKDADEFIEFIVSGATRMRTLINDLLTYSRVGTRGKPFEPVDCRAVVDSALDGLQMMVHECGATITCDPLPTVEADPSQLGQLFQNIINNAIKYHRDEQPRVHVSVENKGNEWLFSVKDNGLGIEPEYADRIFVIFQRLHTKEDYPGTGIGLAVCKKIVERHGGRIWLESQPGTGSTFYFSLPSLRERKL